MMQKQTSLALKILLPWIILSGGCATLSIKTWFLDGEKENSLIRRKEGAVIERLSFSQAQGYRCYSPSDDEAWRERLAQAEAELSH